MRTREIERDEEAETGAEHRAVESGGLIPQPHGGALSPPWRPGVSPNPSGRPAGYVDVATAYASVSVLPWSDVLKLAEGERPARWHQKVPTAAYVRAAKEFIAAPSRATPAELNTRLDGVMKTRLEIGADGENLMALLSGLQPPAAARRAVECVDAEVMPPRLVPADCERR